MYVTTDSFVTRNINSNMSNSTDSLCLFVSVLNPYKPVFILLYGYVILQLKLTLCVHNKLTELSHSMKAKCKSINQIVKIHGILFLIGVFMDLNVRLFVDFFFCLLVFFGFIYFISYVRSQDDRYFQSCNILQC